MKEISIELEKTQKSLKTLNSGSSKLDHILSIGKPTKTREDLVLKVRHMDQKLGLRKSTIFADVATSKSLVAKTIIVATHRNTTS